MTDLIEQGLELLMANVDIKLVIILVAVGFILKHKLTKVDNTDIPIYIGILGVVLAIIFHFGMSKEAILDAIIIGIASAVSAIGVYESQKSLINKFKSKTNLMLDSDSEILDE